MSAVDVLDGLYDMHKKQIDMNILEYQICRVFIVLHVRINSEFFLQKLTD